MFNPILIADESQLSDIYSVRYDAMTEETKARDKKDYVRASRYNNLAFDLTFQLFARDSNSEEKDTLDILIKNSLNYFFKLNPRGRIR